VSGFGVVLCFGWLYRMTGENRMMAKRSARLGGGDLHISRAESWRASAAAPIRREEWEELAGRSGLGVFDRHSEQAREDQVTAIARRRGLDRAGAEKWLARRAREVQQTQEFLASRPALIAKYPDEAAALLPGQVAPRRTFTLARPDGSRLMSALAATPGPFREEPLGLGCRLIGVLRRERANFLTRRPVSHRPLENDVSLGPVPDGRRRDLSLSVPDARAVREIQVLVPREGVEPGQPGPPYRRDEGSKVGRDPTFSLLAVRIPVSCHVGHALPPAGQITALNWMEVPVREAAPQLSEHGDPFLWCPVRLCVFSHAS
jgi:hypothetical protein